MIAQLMSMATPTLTRFFFITRDVARRSLLRNQVFNSWRQFSIGINKNLIHKKTKISVALLSIPATFASFSVMAASGEDNKALIDQVEALYEKKDFHAMYDLLLPHKDSKDANVMWRLARAATEKGKVLGGDERQKHVFEAFEYSKKALELDDNNFACHKWQGILLDYTAEYEGTKQRITNAFKVKEHFMKAIELNPTDATTMYCLGFWCFLFADMPWYQRKVASVIFASPPTSTYEEALKYFDDAEKAEPGFYNQNNVMRAKTMIKLKADKDQAKEILMQAAKFEAKTVDDTKAVEEAKELLSKEFKIKL